MTRIHHAIWEDHPHLNSEKGFQFAPIRLPFLNLQDDHSSITQLITAWHDSEGLCRAIDQVRDGLILMLDRHIDGQSIKCLQRVELEMGTILFPCFDQTGEVMYLSFQICAVGFHLGTTPHSGHYRSALRYRGRWLVYDDNRPPDKLDVLTDNILCNSNLIWLVQTNDAADRTLNDRTADGPGERHGSAIGSSGTAELTLLTQMELRNQHQSLASSSMAGTDAMDDHAGRADPSPNTKRARLAHPAVHNETNSDMLQPSAAAAAHTPGNDVASDAAAASN